jgi:diphthine synthase
MKIGTNHTNKVINMLFFIGLGLNKEQITSEALQALENSDKVYIENYTSNYADNDLDIYEKKMKFKFHRIYREESEQGFSEIIKEAKTKKIAFCVFGNITSATTHSSIINDAKKAKVKISMIPGISIFSVIPMLTGLEEYRFGRTISIVKPVENYSPTSFFDYILQNMQNGLHTICLLDIKIDKNSKYFMQPYEAAARLLEIANEKDIETKNWKVFVVSGACSRHEKIGLTTLRELTKRKTDYDYPSTLVITTKLTMDEEEFAKGMSKL